MAHTKGRLSVLGNRVMVGIRDEAGKFVSLAKIIRDDTERRRARAAAAVSGRLYARWCGSGVNTAGIGRDRGGRSKRRMGIGVIRFPGGRSRKFQSELARPVGRARQKM